jgi:sulfatase modifying factor 1
MRSTSSTASWSTTLATEHRPRREPESRAGGLRSCVGPLLLAPLVVLLGCADLLGFEEGMPGADPCRTDDECGPRAECKYAHCVSRSCASAGTRKCDGLTVVRCASSGSWEPEQECDAICRNGECKPPKSCESGSSVCAQDASCCKSIALEPETYDLPYVHSYELGGQRTEDSPDVTRSVRGFALDRFEVTVRRFRAFMVAYPEARAPKAGSGKHPGFPDSGWKTAWSDPNGEVPATLDTLIRELRGQDQKIDSEAPEDLPVRGVSWYVAFAFCIWDGGRLPTEAEWALAALAGDQKRIFPWSSDWNVDIDHDHAVYSDDVLMASGPEPVGSHPQGVGFFGHDDLAGNLKEWVADSYEAKLPETCDGVDSVDEHECLQSDEKADRVLRGGSYNDAPTEVRNVIRASNPPRTGLATFGFRCARDLSAAP